MKYAVILMLGAFAGFVGAWFLFNSQPMRSVETSLPAAMTARPARVPSQSPIDPDRRTTQPGRSFDAIAQQSTIFGQQRLAWELAASADVPSLEHWIGLCLEESDPLYRHNIASIFLERYVEIDPQAAMDYVRSEFRFNQDTMQSHILTSWVRYDPEAAVDYFRQIQDLRLRDTIGIQLMQDPVLARTGMIAEVAAILGPSADAIRKQIEFQRADPVALFESALTMSGNDQRSRMAYALNRWIPLDPEAALDKVRSLPLGETRNMLLQISISHYAQRDPEGALAYLRLYEPQSTYMQSQVISIMAQHDIDKAIPIAEAFDREAGNSAVMNSVISAWAQNDPTAALSYVETLPPSRRADLYGNIVYQYSREYPQQALNWILDLGPDYAEVARAGLQVIARQDVDLAVTALSRVEGESRDALIWTITEEKSRVDPEDALTWLSGFQREPAYTRAHTVIIGRIAEQSPERAAMMLESATNSEGYEGARSVIAHYWYRKDPEQALSWIATLPQGEKEQAAIAIAANWSGSSSREIDSLIDRLRLSEAASQQVRRMSENHASPGIR